MFQIRKFFVRVVQTNEKHTKGHMSNKIQNRKVYRKSELPQDEFKRRIDALDLECIRKSFVDNFMWGDAVASYVEKQYRKFLLLCGITGELIVPTQAIDAFWHEHITDTLKYHDDCQHLFGFYFHHFPYFGKQGDQPEFLACFEKSKQMFESHFGEAYELYEAINLDPELHAKFFIGGGENCG